MAAGVVDLGGVGGPGGGLHHPLRCVPLPQDQEAGQAAHGVEQVNCSCTITARAANKPSAEFSQSWAFSWLKAPIISASTSKIILLRHYAKRELTHKKYYIITFYGILKTSPMDRSQLYSTSTCHHVICLHPGTTGRTSSCSSTWGCRGTSSIEASPGEWWDSVQCIITVCHNADF